MRINIKSFWPAILWLILSTIAFCLPGKVLPKDDWFDLVQLDKWIHIVLFSVMIILWCIPLLHRGQTSLLKIIIALVLGFFSYGIAMEFVQHYFISNRSFDFGDILADAIGCLVGFLFVKRQLRLTTK